MGEIFLKILNMSIAASWLVLAVVLLRFVLKKAPKWMAVLLWGIVALRLVVPFSFESALSLIPSAETFNAHNIQYETPAISSGIPSVNNMINPVLGETFAPNPAGSVNPLYVWTFIVSVVWTIGIAAMLLYAVISYLRVRRSVAEKVPYEENIFLCDHVKSPFILGLIRPKIYLPSSMDAMAMEPVVAHEKAHLARRDHWWKPLGFLILTIHWFNPLCWIAYVLLCRDIELACDEKVIRQMDLDGKKQYSTALLECSTGRRLVTICPLAFGEVGVKERVKNVLNYKKPAFWVIVVSIVACAVVTICFATNPARNSFRLKIVVPAGSQEPIVYADEEISPLGNHIGIASGDGLGDTEVSLKPVQVRTETAYDEPTYLTPGMPVKLEAEKGGWFRIGVNMQNDTDEDMIVYVEVKNVNVRISDKVSTDQGTIEKAATTLSEEQTTIRQAILEHNHSTSAINFSADPDSPVPCASFVELACVVVDGSDFSEYTHYGWALYEEYRVTDNGLETIIGSHVPVAITFQEDPSGTLTLEEYWEPRDGSYYAQDIREKFPAHIVEDSMDSQKFILQQQQECYTQAIASTGLDTNKVIGTLIETICSSPAQSSNPGDYIERHSIEYRELTYYGRYTLKYCFARFEEGGETGLAGQIMMQVCGDIATGWGEEPLVFSLPNDGVLTGQMWYSAFKNNASSLMEQYSEIELAERCPASYLLLSMLGEM